MRSTAAACLLPLALAACSAGAAPEDARSSAAATSTAPISGLLILPTDQNMVFSFTASGAASVTITDPDNNTQTLAAEVNTAGVASVLFQSLVACTQYSWSITVSGAVAQSGVVNTRYAGPSPACPSIVTITGTKDSFIGYEHQGGNNAEYGPDGYGWSLKENGPIEAVEYGFEHTNDGSDSTVRVWRNRLHYTLSNMEMTRGVSQAVFTATALIDPDNNACTSMSGLPSETTRAVGPTPWTPCSHDSTWEQWTEGLEQCTGLVDTPAGSAVPSGSNIVAILQGEAVTITVGKPSQNIYMGFDAPNDGFPDSLNFDTASNPGFGSDTGVCMATLTYPAMNITLGPMPPETPLCSAVIACKSATITCSASADTFQLYASDATTPNRLVTTVDATTGTVTPVMTDPQGSPSESYTVCTTNGAATNCQPVPVASLTQCPPPPPVPSAIATNSCALWAGSTETATITLSAPAPAGGTLVTLGYLLPQGAAMPVTGPASILIPSGARTGTVSLHVENVIGLSSAEIELTATANGATATTYVPFYTGSIVASVAYPADTTSLMPYQGIGWVGACSRATSGTAVFSTSNLTAQLAATSAPISSSGWAAVDITGTQVAAATDVVTVTEGSTSATISVQVGEAQGGGGVHTGGGCKGTTCQ